MTDSARKEHLTRGNSPSASDIASGVTVREFCSGKTGAHGLSTGMAIFQPNAHFPCHVHKFSEALTILKGEALLLVEGRQYRLRALDCIHLPGHVAHSSANASDKEPLVLHYAFATADPRRSFIEDKFKPVGRELGMPKK